MNKEKMLYHANEKGNLKFDVFKMKGETSDNLQFLLDGGYIERDLNNIYATRADKNFQDYQITNDGKILLAIYRLEYAHNNERDTDKHQGRMNVLKELLEKYNRNITHFEPSLTKNQRTAINYMNNHSTSTVSSYIKKIKDSEKHIINEHTPCNVIPSNECINNIDLDEPVLTSMFNMSVGLGSLKTNNTRTEEYVLRKINEELGEMTLEMNIRDGLSYKEAGKDGVKGEAVDLAICALDMFALQCDNMSPEEMEREFLSYMLVKLHKWRDTLK